MSKLPDFLICGFQKCGTSALFHNLNQHPNISIAKTDHKNCIGSNGKEINFFSRVNDSTYYEGIEWYKNHFKKDGNIWGEVSPSYSNYVFGVTTRMYDYLKNTDTKFVFSVRNPIDRAFSAYNHYMQLYEKNIKWGDWEPRQSFLWNLKNVNDFDRIYIKTLKEYERKFDKSRIHVMVQEKLNDEKCCEDEYNKLFNFLGLEDYKIVNNKHHVRSKRCKVKMTDEEKIFLIERYKPLTNRLFKWLGYEIKEWNDFC